MKSLVNRSVRKGKMFNRVLTLHGFGFTSRRVRKVKVGSNWDKWMKQSSEISNISTQAMNTPEIIVRWWEN